MKVNISKLKKKKVSVKNSILKKDESDSNI